MQERPFDAAALFYPRPVTVTATSLGARTGPKTSRGRSFRRRSRASAVPILCPYLAADDGAWRSSRPSRAHRCDAVTPAAPLALDKQRRLCLAMAYATCATHLAALSEARGRAPEGALEGGDAAPASIRGATRWSLVRTAPVVLDQPGGAGSGGGGRRRLGQWALAGLMAGALGAVVLARLPEAAPDASGSPAVLGATGQPAAAGQAGTPSPRAAVVTPASPSIAASPAPATPTRSPRPSPTPTTAPSADGPSVHRVAAGDTLYAIARAYGTTVEELQAANAMGSSTTLQVGQELQLP